MPKLPQSQGVVVAKPFGQVVRGPRDFVANEMVGVGGQITHGANELERAFRVEQARVNKNIVEDSANELRNKQFELEVGEGGYSHEKSGNAVNKELLKDYSKRFEDAYKDIYGRLKNDDQREAFKRRYDVARGQFQKGIFNHIATEEGVYRKQTMEATIAIEKNIASLPSSSEDEINGSITRAKAAVDAYATANDFDATAKKAAYLTATTPIHKSVIERYINNGNSQGAKKWLNDHEKEIDGDVVRNLRGKLKSANTLGAAQSMMDKIVAKYSDPRQRLAEARKVPDPEQRKLLVSLVKAVNDEDYIYHKRAVDQKDEYVKRTQLEAFNEGLGDITARQAAGHRPTITDVNWTTWEDMGEQHQATLFNMINGVKPPKGSESYYALRALHAKSIEDFMKVPIKVYRANGLITADEEKELFGYQEDYIAGGNEGDIATTKEMAKKQGIADAGLEVDKMISGEEERQWQLAFDAEVKAKGKDVKREDYREIANALNRNILYEKKFRLYPPRSGIDVERPVWKAETLEIPGIPPDIVKRIAVALSMAEEEITVDRIREYYVKRVLGGR